MAADPDTLLRHVRRLATRLEPDGGSDAALLGRFVTDRDERAFAALVDRYGGLVLHVCRRVLGDAHDAEDAFQATFMVLARRAAAVRPGGALAAWLHGVARRVALKARAARARRLRVVGPPPVPLAEARPDPIAELSARELLDQFDAELSRLPEVYRLPVILCCLEGRTQDEAAHQLGWTPGSVRGRLERGRALLYARLARRGLVPTAALAAVELSRGAGSAAVVAGWAAPTVGAALAFAAGRTADGGIVPRAVALAGGVARSMALAQLKVPVALLLATCLLAAGFAAAYRPSDPPRPAAPGVRPSAPPSAAEGGQVAPAAAARDEAAGPWPEEANRPIRVDGRVRDPSGRPFAGAKLYVAYAPRRCDLSALPQLPSFPVRATSGAEGRFDFTFALSDLDERCLDGSRPVVVAAADGFGLAWAEIGDPAALDLNLVEDVPVEGRILDPARRPVAGARVSVRELSDDFAAGLAHYVRNGGRSYFRNCRGPIPGLPRQVTTGPDGRFRLTGVGRDRIVILDLEGAGIAPTNFTASTTATTLQGSTLGATFDYVAESPRAIRGVVRDKATGRPVAGVNISLDSFGPETVTDRNGRYELLCTRASNYAVMAQPQRGELYFAATVRVSAKAGAEPLTADFDLVGGIPLRGRVTDRATGKPPRRAEVRYFPLFPNPHSAALTTHSWMAPSSAPVRPDGSYTLTVLPGPGALVVSASPRDLYASAALDEQELTDLLGHGGDHGGGLVLPTTVAAARERRPVQRYNSIALIKPDELAETLTVDLTVQPSRRVRGTVAGPDGQPLTGVRVSGLTSMADSEVLSIASFTVEGLSPLRPRELCFRHVEKRLGKIVAVRGDEAEPLAVRLEPLGLVSGRLVGRAGKPVPGVRVSFSAGTSGAQEAARTDKDGRFRVSLVAGQEYSLSSARRLAAAARPVKVEAGRDKDLGNILVSD